MSIHRFALVVGLLLCQVSATTPAASSAPFSSQAHVSIATCKTELGTESVRSVPTTTITRTIHDPTPVIVLTRTQVTITVTPAVSTETLTDYETTTIVSTASTITDTFSTTSTEFDTATVTLTPAPVTTTIFATLSTTSTSTSTIATSAGFTPVADTLPPSATLKRSLVENEESCSPYLDDYKYPRKVVCHEQNIIKATTVSTITESPITATATADTSTVTVTNTITSSSVVLPSDVSTTLSYSTTSTITETTVAAGETDTVTSTTTVVGATTATSFYAACATNNIAGLPLSSDFGSAAGKYIYLLAFSHITGQTLRVGNTASAYDCCVSCIESPTCAMSYYNQVSSSVKYCYLMSTTVCSPSTNYATVLLQDAATTMQVSNGNCGHITE
jgi:hypothetical protein